MAGWPCLGLLVVLLLTVPATSEAAEVELLAPVEMARETGAPTRWSQTFESVLGEGTLSIRNGDAEGSRRVSSARVWLNGKLVFAPSDFHQNVSGLSAGVALVTGLNILEVEMRSAPGSLLEARIFGEVEGTAAAQIGPEGGFVGVDDPAHPLHGIGLDIPEGAVARLALFTIGLAPAPGASLPEPAVFDSPAFRLEASEPLERPIFAEVPFWGGTSEEEGGVVFHFDPLGNRWEAVEPVPGPDPETARVLLPHLSIFARGRIPFGVNELRTTFSIERDVHRNRNDRIGCRCDDGTARNNGLCSGMTLLAQVHFDSFLDADETGLYCRWGGETDFAASCEAHCRFSGGQVGWVDDFVQVLKILPSTLGLLHQGYVLDYVKFHLLLGQPTSLALLGTAGGELFAGHAVLAVGWAMSGQDTGEIEIYDPNFNEALHSIAYLRPRQLGRAALAYQGESFTYVTATPISPLGLGLEELIRSFPKEDVCSSVTCNPTTIGNGTVKILGGSLAGQALGPDAWTVYLGPGQRLAGTVQVETHNFMGSNAVAPFGYTWTWGERTTALRTVSGWIASGRRTWSLPIDLPAPTLPGTYYLLFGFNGEFNLSQVMSCDNWSAPGIIWSDGNDYHDLDAPRLECAHRFGYAPEWRYRFPSFYRDWEIPVAPIQVIVEP